MDNIFIGHPMVNIWIGHPMVNTWIGNSMVENSKFLKCKQNDKVPDVHLQEHVCLLGQIWALSRENLSSGFMTKQVSNQYH